MSNEVVDLKLNGTGGEVAKPEQPDVQGQESFEGSFRYDALKDADVNNLVSDSRPTLITLFGISECGKTTFVGSLFAILRRRPSLLMKTFIDSDTLTGFERRVHQRFLSEVPSIFRLDIVKKRMPAFVNQPKNLAMAVGFL